MSGKEFNSARLAIWLLRHTCPGRNNETMAGDLLERFRERRSHGWLWKQVFIAIAVGVMTETRQHWPQICYAITGTVTFVGSIGKLPEGARIVVPWWVLPWPLSMLGFDLSPNALPLLAALLPLAVALLVNRAFRWVSLVRTGVISFMLIAINQYLLPLAFPHRQGTEQPLISPEVFRVLLVFLIFFTLLVSAWLGCRSRWHAKPSGLSS